MGFFKSTNWHKIANSPEDIILGNNNISEIEVNGKVVCVAKGNKGWYAFAQKCPHAGGFMSEGYIDNSDFVVCPVHRYKFDLSNGRNPIEGYYLKTYKVEIRPDGVFLAI
ncbi:MAG: hypothetical protein NVSMB45_09420 [Ginsengibacter sp.]